MLACSSFVLSEKKELLLVVEGHVVSIQSTSVSKKFVMPTSNQWMVFIVYWKQIDEQLKTLIRETRGTIVRKKRSKVNFSLHTETNLILHEPDKRLSQCIERDKSLCL